MLLKDINLIISDITNESLVLDINSDFDYIIDCASETKSKNMMEYLVETALGIIQGTKNILEIARKCRSMPVVVLSSVEVYGIIKYLNGSKIDESTLGVLNLFSKRSCYSMSKRKEESLCMYYYFEYNVPIKIARFSGSSSACVK